MTISYTPTELVWYLMLYSLLGWSIEVCIDAVTKRQFINRGLLNLPFSIPCGITGVVLMLVLPTLKSPIAQFLMILAVYRIVLSLCRHFVSRISGAEAGPKTPFLTMLLASTAISLGYLILYLLIHPLLLTLQVLTPDWIVSVTAILFLVLVAVDFLCVRHTLRTHRLSPTTVRHLSSTQRLADRMTDAIWNRLHKAYPNLSPEGAHDHIFAQGLCFDKLFWVFLVSSVLGAGIEMVFCRVRGSVWMNRSSLLYGPFSVVWGIGAVVLTVVLQRLHDRPDRSIFLAGGILGGVYEYLCSVFTEVVFGTVFWDYSAMPLNLGGRINLLYCIFWGILAVLWLRVLYPPMDQAIEKLPPLAGKLITWTLVLLMAANAGLTSAAMVRYTHRQEDFGIIGTFLDERYPDDYMENRWPNMKVTE